MGSDSGYDNPHLTSYIGRSVVHRNAKRPRVNSLELFIPQTGVRWICGESFELLPEFDPYFFRKVIQLFQNGIGNDDVSRQSAFEPLSRI